MSAELFDTSAEVSDTVVGLPSHFDASTNLIATRRDASVGMENRATGVAASIPRLSATIPRVHGSVFRG